MGFARRAVVPLALCAALWAAPSQAADLRLGLMGDYWTAPSAGLFGLNFAVTAPIVRRLAVGGRFGAIFVTPAPIVGIPADFLLRVNVDQLYLEGLVGPWILFTGAPLRAHAGFGFGLQTRSLSVGLEVGYLQPSAHVGLRFGFRL
jgi:hypothetical protein